MTKNWTRRGNGLSIVYGLNKLHFAAALIVLMLAGCGGGGGAVSTDVTPTPTPTPPPTVAVSGTVSTPGGALAFNAPTGVQRFFAEIFGGSAIAALPGTTGAVGVKVKLLQIDNAGTQVGGDLATAVTTTGGSFVLNAPAGFTPAPNFVIRAAGTTETLDRLVTSLTDQSVDPASEVTKTLVLASVQSAGGSLQDLPPLQVDQVYQEVTLLVANVDAASTTSTATLVAALTTEAQNDEELKSATANLTAAGGVSGTVTDSAGAPLANIKIVARDFNQWVSRAETRTDSDGQYSMALAAGDYIVGAVNATDTSMAASEWWTCNDVASGPMCGTATQKSASRVTVGASLSSTDFKLEPGARVSGTITGSGAALPGVGVAVRDFASNESLVSPKAQGDGSFLINIRPGTYYLSARNRTAQPFATALYNGPAGGGTASSGGGTISNEATPIKLVAGNSISANFPLAEGGLVQGVVTDGGTPVSGMPVRFYLTDSGGAFVEGLRTNNIGAYRMWVRPGTYAVRSRGQTATPTVAAFSSNNSPAAVDFSAAVGRATATILSPGGTGPSSDVKVRVYDTSGAFIGHETSNGDGTVEVFAQPTGNYLIEYKVDNGSITVGTANHDGTATPTGTTRLLATTPVNFDTATTTPTALGTITMPAGGELTGTVTLGGVPAGNIRVELRRGGTNRSFRVTDTRTQSDGSYTISAVAGPYDRVCAFVPGTSGPCNASATLAGAYASADNVPLIAGQSNTLNIAIP